MGKPTRILLLAGLVLLLALPLPWAALADTVTPKAPTALPTSQPTGTVAPTAGATTTGAAPTGQPTAAGGAVVTATPQAGAGVTSETMTPQGTPAAQELPTSGAESPANMVWSLLPIAALLLLAVPALMRIAGHRR